MTDNTDTMPAADEPLETGLAELQRTADDYMFTVDLAVVLFQSSPDAIIVVGSDGRVRLVNGQAEFLTGYHRSELRGAPIECLLPESRRERHSSTYRESFMTEPRMRSMGTGLDLKLRRKDGQEVPVDINLSPVVTVRGMFVIATVRRRQPPAANPGSQQE